MIASLHVHSIFSDGRDTPEDIVRAAVACGIDVLGFSDHAYTSFDTSCCMKKEDVPRYKATISELKKRYEGQIRVLCGIEQDLFSDFAAEGFDYVIGSAHYLRVKGEYYGVDESAEETRRAIDRAFGGDPLSFAQAYYELESRVVEAIGADIIGHFDLIEKFSEKEPSLVFSGDGYAAAWKGAMERLTASGKPFEINTGAMSRGWRTTPYLYGEKLAYALSRGANVLLTSDAHTKETLLYGFETYASLVPDNQQSLDFLPFIEIKQG